jgi:PEP-CTERM motif-containing protein
MKRKTNRVGTYGISAILACASLLSVQLASAQDPVIFSDTFGSGSTLNAAPTAPTANSTSYEQGLGITVTGSSGSIASGDLSLVGGSTGSLVNEVGALFTATPLTLSGVGSEIDLQVVWVATSNILSGASTGSQIALGLYNSGGSAPQQGTTIFDSGTSPTGGAKGWEGYAASTLQAGTSKIYPRSVQNNATLATNQELLFNNVSSSQSYHDPAGGNLTGASKTSTNNLTAGATYTSELRITLTGATSLAVSNTLFSGAGTGGTVLWSENGTTNNATDVTFDGLAFGYRYSGTSAASELDINSITVSTNIPEPSTWMLVASGLALMIGLARNRR